MATVTSKDGTIIAFDKKGTGPAVLLVDGALAYRQHHGGEALAKALSKDFTVYYYDRRGRGESTATEPYAVEREIEDMDTLIKHAGGSAFLYGASAGAVLALKAASALGPSKVTKLALYEPPLSTSDQEKQDFEVYKGEVNDLLKAGKRGDAVVRFLRDMLPPDALEKMQQSPEWALMESVASTLAYDNVVMGDAGVPAAEAQAIRVPTLVMNGEASYEFLHQAVDALIEVIPNAQKKVLSGQTHDVSPEAIAPILREFFG